MKKSKLILIVGIFFLLFGLVFALLTPNKKVGKESTKDITEEEAKSIIREKIEDIINLHENPNKIFETEEVENEFYLLAKDYNEVINKKFTDKYKNMILKTEINKKKLVLIEEDKHLVLKPISDIKYVIGSANIKINFLNNEKIEGEIDFSDYKLNDKDELEYLIYKKNIVLIKLNNVWLIDEFVY